MKCPDRVANTKPATNSKRAHDDERKQVISDYVDDLRVIVNKLRNLKAIERTRRSMH